MPKKQPTEDNNSTSDRLSDFVRTLRDDITIPAGLIAHCLEVQALRLRQEEEAGSTLFFAVAKAVAAATEAGLPRFEIERTLSDTAARRAA